MKKHIKCLILLVCMLGLIGCGNADEPTDTTDNQNDSVKESKNELTADNVNYSDIKFFTETAYPTYITSSGKETGNEYSDIPVIRPCKNKAAIVYDNWICYQQCAADESDPSDFTYISLIYYGNGSDDHPSNVYSCYIFSSEEGARNYYNEKVKQKDNINYRDCNIYLGKNVIIADRSKNASKEMIMNELIATHRKCGVEIIRITE